MLVSLKPLGGSAFFCIGAGFVMKWCLSPAGWPPGLTTFGLDLPKNFFCFGGASLSSFTVSPGVLRPSARVDTLPENGRPTLFLGELALNSCILVLDTFLSASPRGLGRKSWSRVLWSVFRSVTRSLFVPGKGQFGTLYYGG